MSLNVKKIKTILYEHGLLQSTNAMGHPEFEYISYDSRDIQKNTLFFCKGNFKPEYLETAKEAGATGVVSERHLPASAGMNEFIVKDIQKSMALLSAAFFNYPQDELYIIAITGTKCKTTSAYFVRDAIQNATNDKVAIFSTINTVIGNAPSDNFKSHLTTPESLDIFHNMRRAVNNGMKILVMEVSSQAYLKNRVYGLKYDIGSFLNISSDHVGENEHPTVANYLHCKEQLLVNSKITIINAETDNLKDVYYTAKATCNPENIYLFARKNAKLEIPIKLDFIYSSEVDTLKLNEIYMQSLTKKAKKLDLDGSYRLGLPGDYNEPDAADAIISAGIAGFKRSDLTKGIASTQIPGRMEIYETKHNGTVYVDYAHNYSSMHSLLSFLKSQNPDGKVIVVVGCTGNKGIIRRKGIGKALSENADVAYLTMQDPAFEDPKEISKEIDSHIDHSKVDVHFVMNRETAIADAIKQGKNDDIIVIAGKGRDPYQKINGVDTPYPTDTVIVKELVKELNKNDC
ncbi:UDP-N-acetylmuramoyl-L-alanyl-D-glutamate--2,6-diaminopimelate ligase [Fructilactobacillus lindneri]|uniref:UDP-N-acetylmuramoylalanyl-D-glutamate--2, 6-diaminopimelate ligase n=2 Tax=Fructilactobacillus lindneri TaxID=53444 RepID=A0A0R2JPV0_9LACO|nr:UDP-N-acetylmuramoyl-L-alanyl-D-glutamate--2,6-diaminopimelate ligase [Fructilactobacillus lindneri]ANZ58294.1 UDP-N-acetylmuramoyl-L-alanyl-D-glutamate--2,6-diaminopimelate ligase [Fructilactobacillus lindneri]ANZ59616.1 UDP-N-acetylmuramoyl-L-alanyl-D-glutamate--2,6-diaminopimelate ligase [Fructilactobacillus lindneri]KRN79121.1 UDP-N-acetylmuramoylalanyl-D-glutamate--2,6-diaminopimelate ligase [Fructilactobacillus lindneri DSM 20690 = JCM 11027]POG98600.1 UDP-N-acetylmuramoyl-L-alanyl-D-g